MYAPLDREHLDAYILTVQCRDSGQEPLVASTPALVNVRVLDLNDNPPAFTFEAGADIHVSEGEAVGNKVCVGSVGASVGGARGVGGMRGVGAVGTARGGSRSCGMGSFCGACGVVVSWG